MDRKDVRRNAGQMALLVDDDLLQLDLLRAAFPGAGRDAAPHSRLRAAVHRFQHDFVDRRIWFRPVATAVPVRGAEVHPQRRESPAEALGGRGLAGVDAPADAGAVSQLRDAADGEVISGVTAQVVTLLQS